MINNIDFSNIDCDALQYVKQGSCYVCLDMSIELRDTDECMQCKFRQQLREEKEIRKNRTNKYFDLNGLLKHANDEYTFRIGKYGDGRRYAIEQMRKRN